MELFGNVFFNFALKPEIINYLEILNLIYFKFKLIFTIKFLNTSINVINKNNVWINQNKNIYVMFL